jgi:peptide/nickel transport system permease protein
LAVGLAATFVAVALGASVGIASGHYRNFVGAALERFTDWFLVIPWLPLAIVIITLLGGGLAVIIVVIGVTSWAGTARLVRAQTLSIEGRPYMERAQVLGVGNTQQMTRHVLPNVLPLILANATLTVSIAILTETTLSFLGLGDPAHPSWGTMLEDAYSASAITNGAWWWVLPPGICIVLVVLSFTLIGRALEVVFNPRLSQELP